MTSAHTQALLRSRDRARRSAQVWTALAVIWGVVLGWCVWGLINAFDGDQISTLAWVAYLVPLAALIVGALIAWSRWRATGRALLADAESHHH